MANICNDLMDSEGIVDSKFTICLAKFSVGQDLVYVLVAAMHRKNVFPVLGEAVDRYNKEAPVFKKEYVITKKRRDKCLLDR